jgi:hypothetical protein
MNTKKIIKSLECIEKLIDSHERSVLPRSVSDDARKGYNYIRFVLSNLNKAVDYSYEVDNAIDILTRNFGKMSECFADEPKDSHIL